MTRREQCSRIGAPPIIHDFSSYFLHLLIGSASERTNFVAHLPSECAALVLFFYRRQQNVRQLVPMAQPDLDA